MGVTVVSKNKSVKTEVQNLADGTKITTTTTTTVTKYSDGSTETNVDTDTLTETPASCASKAAIQPVAGSSKPAPATTQPSESQKPQGASTSSPTNNAGGSGAKTDNKFLQEALKAHNELRAKHGSPPLVLDTGLNEVAQKWVDQLAVMKKMEHSTTDYGENIYYSTKPGVDGSTAVHSWYREIDDHDFKKAKPQKGTGHFTQVIWKASKKLGIARAYDNKGGIYVVANYDPAGNFIGEYVQNVVPLPN